MGNCFRRCLGDDSDYEDSGHGYGGSAGGGGAGTGTVYTVVGFTAVERDLLEFEATNKVPRGLGYYVSASESTQRIWFEKLLAAWKKASPAPASAEAVAVLLTQTLQDCPGLQGLLSFYHLPWLPIRVVHQPVPTSFHPELEEIESQATGNWLVEPDDAAKIDFEIQTLPVKWEENCHDGDGFTVLVDVSKNARETANLPKEIKAAVKKRRKARAQQKHDVAKELQKQIEAGNYKMIDGKNGCLTHKYRIRLRGVDAPEIGQPYGDEARDILRDLVKDQCVVIHVYNVDKHERLVGDVFCHGTFIQEELLKKGSVWHFEYHDKRANFAKWERAAKAARIGLWADANPEEPWDYRRKKNFGKNKRGSFRKGGA